MGRVETKFDVPPGARTSSCRSKRCGQPIYWVRTRRNRKMPVNLDGTPHWSSCPDSETFRDLKPLEAPELRNLIEELAAKSVYLAAHENRFVEQCRRQFAAGLEVGRAENIRAQIIMRNLEF